MGDDNIWTDTWDEGEDWSGGGARAKRLPRGDELGATVYELGPGNWLPFHFHHGSEEYFGRADAAGRRCAPVTARESSRKGRRCTSRAGRTVPTGLRTRPMSRAGADGLDARLAGGRGVPGHKQITAQAHTARRPASGSG
jgi:hypothetical protein